MQTYLSDNEPNEPEGKTKRKVLGGKMAGTLPTAEIIKLNTTYYVQKNEEELQIKNRSESVRLTSYRTDQASSK